MNKTTVKSIVIPAIIAILCSFLIVVITNFCIQRYFQNNYEIAEGYNITSMIGKTYKEVVEEFNYLERFQHDVGPLYDSNSKAYVFASYFTIEKLSSSYTAVAVCHFLMDETKNQDTAILTDVYFHIFEN